VGEKSSLTPLEKSPKEISSGVVDEEEAGCIPTAGGRSCSPNSKKLLHPLPFLISSSSHCFIARMLSGGGMIGARPMFCVVCTVEEAGVAVKGTSRGEVGSSVVLNGTR
jgi:hypothetical protein